MRSLLLVLLSLPMGLALALESVSSASDPVAVYRTDEAYGDVKEYLEMAITDRGMLVTNTLHISEMLQRTAADTGLDKIPYLHAESLEFCSILMSYKMSLAHPANMATCPLTLSIYQTVDEPDQTYIAYRRAKLLGPADQVQQELNDLLDGIVSDALE